ncbi:MAG: sigma-70 family RNA polymerase sigma factor [Acidobacteria bacterium]|nr:sigma-70 family RNA polymerase sigma factor [Acidobacteriota bacterium]
MTTDLQALGEPSRALRQQFDELVFPHRQALWRFCRKLTGNPWDAEDLVQDTLLKAFARLSFAWQPVEPRAYLFRIASNGWIDRWRRDRATTELDEAAPAAGATPEPDPLETRDALRLVVDSLPPRQRVVFLLTEAFGFTHADVAAMLGLSLGAVKALRFRARETLAMKEGAMAPMALAPPGPGASDHPGDPVHVLERYVDAFNRRDVEALVALFHGDIVNEIVGVADEAGAEVMTQNSLAEWLADPLPTRGLVTQACGRPVVVVMQQDDAGAEAIAWVVDATVTDGLVQSQRLYCFCPELLDEVGAELGLPVRTRGYTYAGTPA